MKIKEAFYDPNKTYEDNLANGPFGAFADGTRIQSINPPAASFLGLPVHLPFGIAAGPLINSTFVNRALDKGFDLAVYKTVRSTRHACHPWPNILPLRTSGNLTFEEAEKGLVVANEYKEPLAITNSFGVPSSDPTVWQPDMAKSVRYAKTGQVVIGSFQGSRTIADFVYTAHLVKETGVPVMEVNTSCPNEGTGNLLCFDIPKTKEIIMAIKKEIGSIPLIVKIAYFKDQFQLIEFVKEIGPLVEGVSAINTIPAKIFTESGKPALPGQCRLISGVCGQPIKWAGLDMVKRLHKLREEFALPFSIIGVGGVTDSNDYKEYIDSGADAVMCATGAMWNPLLALEIRKDNNIS